MTPVRLEPAAPRSGVKHSTTEPLRSLDFVFYDIHSAYRFFLCISNAKYYIKSDKIFLLKPLKLVAKTCVKVVEQKFHFMTWNHDLV